MFVLVIIITVHSASCETSFTLYSPASTTPPLHLPTTPPPHLPTSPPPNLFLPPLLDFLTPTHHHVVPSLFEQTPTTQPLPRAVPGDACFLPFALAESGNTRVQVVASGCVDSELSWFPGGGGMSTDVEVRVGEQQMASLYSPSTIDILNSHQRALLT